MYKHIFIIIFFLLNQTAFANKLPEIENNKSTFDDCFSNTNTKFVFKNYLNFIDPNQKLGEISSLTKIYYSNS
jgi:hypothetical protein